jgi:hypothetical protein
MIWLALAAYAACSLGAVMAFRGGANRAGELALLALLWLLVFAAITLDAAWK